VVVEREIRTGRYVVPRHKPEARYVDPHIVVKETALVPRRIVRRALDHRTAGRDRHVIRENSTRAVDRLEDVHLREMTKRLRPIDGWHLLSEIERFREPDEIFL
jgi:hypothetical protein